MTVSRVYILLSLIFLNDTYAQKRFIITASDTIPYSQFSFKKISQTPNEIRYLLNQKDTIKGLTKKNIKNLVTSDSFYINYLKLDPRSKDTAFVSWLAQRISKETDSFYVTSIYRMNDSLWYRKGLDRSTNLMPGDTVYRDSLMKKIYVNSLLPNKLTTDANGVVKPPPPPPPPPPPAPLNWKLYFFILLVGVVVISITILIYKFQFHRIPKVSGKSSSDDVENLKGKINDYKKENKDLEESNNDLHTKLSKLNTEFNKVEFKLKEFEKIKNEEIRKINADYSEKISKLIQEHKDKTTSIESHHKESLRKLEEKHKADLDSLNKMNEELRSIFKSIADLYKNMENDVFKNAGAISNKELMMLLVSYILRIAFISGSVGRHLTQESSRSDEDMRNLDILLQRASSPSRVISISDEPNKMDPVLFAVIQLLRHFEMKELRGVYINGIEIASKN
jgi:hypothetical protein